MFGNWLAAEELAEAVAIRRLAKPRVPRKLIEPLNDDELRELLARAGTRDQAILLLLLDTGLRVSEAAGIRFRDLRPDLGSSQGVDMVDGLAPRCRTCSGAESFTTSRSSKVSTCLNC